MRVGQETVTTVAGETVVSPAPGSAVTVSSGYSMFDGAGIRRSAYCPEHWEQFSRSATPLADATVYAAPVRAPVTQDFLRDLLAQQEA